MSPVASLFFLPQVCLLSISEQLLLIATTVKRLTTNERGSSQAQRPLSGATIGYFLIPAELRSCSQRSIMLAVTLEIGFISSLCATTGIELYAGRNPGSGGPRRLLLPTHTSDRAYYTPTLSHLTPKARRWCILWASSASQVWLCLAEQKLLVEWAKNQNVSSSPNHIGLT